MSRPICSCCLSLPLGKKKEQPFAIEIPLNGKDWDSDVRDRFELCSACAIFVCQEVSRKMDRGGGFAVLRGAIQSVKESYERGRESR